MKNFTKKFNLTIHREKVYHDTESTTLFLHSQPLPQHTKAAEELYVTQPTISMAIRDLAD